MPDVLSILKLGSNDINTFEVALGSRAWAYSLTEKGGASFREKLRGRLDPLVSASYF